MRHFNFNEIGSEIQPEGLIDLLNSQRGGSFFVLHGYISKASVKGTMDGDGEEADYYCQYGVNYGSLKEADIAAVRQARYDGWLPTVDFRVTRGTYIDGDGNEHDRKAKGRTFHTVRFTPTAEEIGTALAEILNSLEAPKPATAHYDKEAKGMYSNQSDGSWHIRECLIVHRVTTREGDWKPKATSRRVAVRNAVKKALKLKTARYRQFCFSKEVKPDGMPEGDRFESITIGGQSILVDAANDTTLLALPEHVKEAQAAAIAD